MAAEILIIKHIPIEGPGSIETFFQNTTWDMRIIDLSQGETLPNGLEDIEAVVSLGGPMNVYEETKFPFLKKEDEFLRRALGEEIPILGICLGAQLLAKACGAKITRAKHREIGWHQVNLTREGKDGPLFAGLSSPLDVFQWHEDTFEIPQGGVLLAEAPSCRNQAFRYARNAYGLQFHVEVIPEMVGSWIEVYAKDTAAQDLDGGKMLVESYKKRETIEKQASMIYLNFARIIHSSRKARVY